MALSFELTDVPAVDASDLAAALRALIENGRGLVLLNGASDADLDLAHEALLSNRRNEPQRVLAAFIRFRQLIEVFGTRRLQQLLLEKGHALLAPAIAIAATQRLNAQRGFSPQRIISALAVAPAANVVGIEGYRANPATEIEHRYAA
ncbi:MAG: hypothetical protein WC829_05480 [Hyphomicrobium sp.]|jgi:hypothetical protein